MLTDRKLEKMIKLEIPKDVLLYEHSLATYWTDGSGIWYTVAKSAPRTLEAMRDNIAFLKRLFDGKKVCIVADATNVDQYDKETRAYLAYELPNVYKALAIISASTIGRTMANTFILSHILNPLPVPMKMFRAEEEAKAWLQEYL